MEVVECLIDYGCVQYDHHGARIVFFDKASRRRLQRDGVGQRIRNFDRYLRAYAVITTSGIVRSDSGASSGEDRTCASASYLTSGTP